MTKERHELYHHHSDHPSPPKRQPQDVTHTHHRDDFPATIDRKRVSLATLESGRQIWRVNSRRSKRLESLMRRQLRLLQNLEQEHLVSNFNTNASNVSWEGELGDCQTNENVVTPDSPLTRDDDGSIHYERRLQITEASILEEISYCDQSAILNFHGGAEKNHKINCDIPSIHIGMSNQCILLDFGGAEINEVGKTRSLSFLAQAPVLNPNDSIQTTNDVVYPVEFEFDSFPFESGFDVSMIDPTSEHSSSEDLHPPVGIHLRDGEYKHFFITWKPIKVGGVREVILLAAPGGMNQIVVVGNAGNNECECSLQEREIGSNTIVKQNLALDVRKDDGDPKIEIRTDAGHRHWSGPNMIDADPQLDRNDTTLSDYGMTATSIQDDENSADNTSMNSESSVSNESGDAGSYHDECIVHDSSRSRSSNNDKNDDASIIQKERRQNDSKHGESGLNASNAIEFDGRETIAGIRHVKNGSCRESQDDSSGEAAEVNNVSYTESLCADVASESKNSKKEIAIDELYKHDDGRQSLVGAYINEDGPLRDVLADPELDYIDEKEEKSETVCEVSGIAICTEVHSAYSVESPVYSTGSTKNDHGDGASNPVQSHKTLSASIDVGKLDDHFTNGNFDSGNSQGSYSQSKSDEVDSSCPLNVETKTFQAEPLHEGALYLQTTTFVDSLFGDVTEADETHFSELETLTSDSVQKKQIINDQVQNYEEEIKHEGQLNEHFTFNIESYDNQESNEHLLEPKKGKKGEGPAEASSCESASSDSDEPIISRDISALVLEMEKELQDVTDYVSMTGDTPKSNALPLEDDYSDSDEEVDAIPHSLGRTFSNDSSAHLIMLNDQVADDLLLHSNQEDVSVEQYLSETTDKSTAIESLYAKEQTTPKHEDKLSANLCNSTPHVRVVSSIPATPSVCSPMAKASPLVCTKTDSQSNYTTPSLSDIALEKKHVSSTKKPTQAPESPRTMTRKTARMYYFYKSPKEESKKKKKSKKKRVNLEDRSPLFSCDRAIDEKVDVKPDEISLKRKRDFKICQHEVSSVPSFTGAERRVHSRSSTTPTPSTHVNKTLDNLREQNLEVNKSLHFDGTGKEAKKINDVAESSQEHQTKRNFITNIPTAEKDDYGREQSRSHYHVARRNNPVNTSNPRASLINTPISVNNNRNKLRSKRFSTPHYSSKSKYFNMKTFSNSNLNRKSFSPSHLATKESENPMSDMISEMVTESAQSCYFFRPPENTVSKETSSRHLRTPRVPRTSFEDSTASSRAKIIPDTPYAKLKYGQGSVKHLSLHSRCQVQPGSRRGKIAYIGAIDELGGGGYWVGVILDEPLGKTDGTVQSSGIRYFEAPGSHRGGFFRGKNVEMGDFPCIDVIDELEGVAE